MLRQRLSDWLATLGVLPFLAADIVLAVNEACTNSIEHAYLGRQSGTVRLSADANPNAIDITIEDFGRWKTTTSDDNTRGRGLPLMRAMSSHIDMHTSTTGTCVTMRFPPPQSVHLPTA